MHMLKNRLEKDKTWQKGTDINYDGREKVVKNKSDHETQKNKMEIYIYLYIYNKYKFHL